MAEEILIALFRNKTDLFEELLNGLIETHKIEIPLLELVYHLTERVGVSQKHLDTFVDRCFVSCEGMEKSAKIKQLKNTCKFVCGLQKKGLFDCKNKIETWMTHCSNYESSGIIREFRKFINEKLNN